MKYYEKGKEVVALFPRSVSGKIKSDKLFMVLSDRPTSYYSSEYVLESGYVLVVDKELEISIMTAHDFYEKYTGSDS